MCAVVAGVMAQYLDWREPSPAGVYDRPWALPRASRDLKDPGRTSLGACMTGERRRLAAIMLADVVGSSRLMGRDESGTLARLRELRKQHFGPALAWPDGRLVKLVEDGALVEFPSARAPCRLLSSSSRRLRRLTGTNQRTTPSGFGGGSWASGRRPSRRAEDLPANLRYSELFVSNVPI